MADHSVAGAAIVWAGLALAILALWARGAAGRARQHRHAGEGVRAMRARLAVRAQQPQVPEPTQVLHMTVRLAGEGGSETIEFIHPVPHLTAWVCPVRHPDGLTSREILAIYLEGRASVEHIFVSHMTTPQWRAQLTGAIRSHRYVCGAPRPRRPIDGEVPA